MKKYISVLLAACFFSACVSNAFSGKVKIPQDIAGIVHAGHTNTEEEYDLLDKLGAAWLLTTFYWQRIERQEGQWNFDYYDQYVDYARARGKKIIGILAYDVTWIHMDGKAKKYIPADKMHYFENYVKKTTEHFKGRVDAWCIWNEPNSHFWKGSKEEYFSLFSKAADALREADHDVMLLGGAFNRGFLGLPRAYAHGIFLSGAMEKADAFAVHPYELNPRRMLKLYNEFHTIAAQYGFDDKIWVSETGYPTGGLYPTATTEKKFPAYIIKTFINLAINGADKIIWYQLFDPVDRKRANSEDFFGLVRSKDDYTSKGAEAFRLCAEYLSGTTFYPELPLCENPPKSLQAFYFEKEKGGALVMWKNGTPVKVKVNINADGDEPNVFLHDPVSGNAEAISGEALISVNAMPVFITWDEKAQVQTGINKPSKSR